MKNCKVFYEKAISDKKIYRKISAITTMIFPLFLVVIVENTHIQSLFHLFNFMLGSFGIFLYDVFFVAIIFTALTLIFRHVWLAMFIESIVLYTFSIIEFYKFDANGTHFIITDLFMADKISDIACFTKLNINYLLVVNFILIIGYVLWAAFLRIKVNFHAAKSLGLGFGCMVAFAAMITVPKVYSVVYSTFGINYNTSHSPYSTDEAFQTNMQIAFLSQNISMELTNNLTEPESYSKKSIDAILPKPQRSDDICQKPDIIMIMSESFTDFRKFDSISVPEATYENYDRIASEGYKGEALMPTFGGYTCKSEFELLFGLPVKGINNQDIPHQLFLESKPRPTFSSYLKKQGYNTSFIHPFSATFYNRDKAYKSYDFDNLYFEDDIKVEKSLLGQFIDDHTLVEQIKQTLDSPEEKPQFIFAVSMQNHVPFSGNLDSPVKDNRLTIEEQNQLGSYLYGVGKTDKAIGELVEYLKARNKPVVLLFVGDHYPYLGKQGKLYKKILGNTDGDRLYQQDYLLWSNLTKEYNLPSQRISAFYLPLIVSDYVNLPKNRFMTFMNEALKTTPIFTFDSGDNSPDAEKLMELSYDRTVGECYSAEK